MRKILTGSLFLLICASLSAIQEESLRPYRLLHADSLRISKTAQEYVSFLQGDVHLFYGETEFYCQRAELYEKQKITRMAGAVKVLEDSLTLYADEVDYYRLEDRITLQGNVLVREDHADSTYRTFSASRVVYRRGERQFEAYDGVTVYDQRENMSGECGEMHYFQGQGYGYLIKSPVLRVLSRDSLTVEAEKIEYFREFQKVTANFQVRTISRDFLVESDFLLYFHQEGQAIYLGEPVFTSEFADARAQEIRVFFQDEKLHRAELQDSCRLDFAGEDELEKANWVTSDYMEFTFTAGAVSACLAEGNVLSYFRQEASAKQDLAINDVQSRSLVVDLDKGRINSVIMQNSVKGRYKFRQN